MEQVFAEFVLPNMRIANRIVRSATNDHLGHPDGTISLAEVELYEELAANEVGLIISAHVCVSADGRADRTQNFLFADHFIEGLRQIPPRVAAHGSKMVVQINHAGGKANPACNDGKLPLAPSAVHMGANLPVAQELTKQEIARIRDEFIAAAQRVQQAGFAGVQVHCAHGYLLSQFISPATNWRTDEYGGTVENRFRLAAEIISGIKAACGAEFPVFIKINSNDKADDAAYEQDLSDILRCCKAVGVEAVELSGFDFTTRQTINHRAFYLERAAKLRKLVDIPLILVGGIKSLPDMQTALAEGIDMVAICRGLLCEPDLIPKLKAGQAQARCISCNQCFSIFDTKGKRCVFHTKMIPNFVTT